MASFEPVQGNHSLLEEFANMTSTSINLPDLTPESALLGLNTALDNSKYVNTLINHLILIFKKSLYEMRLRLIPSSVHYIKSELHK